jgi:hypothetical protein
MTDEPSRPIPRHYWRPDPDVSREELEAGAAAFLEVVLGPVRYGEETLVDDTSFSGDQEGPSLAG